MQFPEQPRYITPLLLIQGLSSFGSDRISSFTYIATPFFGAFLNVVPAQRRKIEKSM
jgi:hypothetical protein